uniref:Transmembrane protein 209 n=1 Tax=Amphimedon queenslandica TaxID=400682 RepID=A0A1X7TYU3_AMPQE
MAVQQRRLPVSSVQSPAVSAAIAHLHHYSRAKSAIRWGALSSVAMIALLVDMYFCLIAFLTSVSTYIILMIESVLLFLLFLCVLYDIVYYVCTVWTNSKVKVTQKQKDMLGIPKEICGFQTVSTPVNFPSISSTPTRPKYTPPAIATPFSGKPSPNNYYYQTPGSTQSQYSTPSHSHSFSNNSIYSPSRSPGHTSSPFTSDRISTRKSLTEYLRGEEEKEQKHLHGSPDYLSGSWYGSPNGGGGAPALRKYHVATRTPYSPDDDERDSETLWSRLRIKKDDVNEWTVRCRKWLAQTVIIPISKEIHSMNKKLEGIGSKKLIGIASVAQLQDEAILRGMILPSLSMLLRYLSLSTRQDYLVKRIHDLAEGGSIVNFKWDSGGTWKGRKWDQDSPTDTEIVQYFLCTYLDSQIPPSPQFPDGKTFTSQYFVKTPDKPGT